MTHYDAGRRFEYRVRDHLIAEGYDVIRSAGSKTKVDLVAFKPGQVLLVQCKVDGQIRPIERRELLRIASHLPAAVPVVAQRQARKLALVRLTGPGPKDRTDWTTDEVGAA